MSTPTTEDSLRQQLSELREECATLTAALHTVLCESEDPESVRTCASALWSTNIGRHHLTLHPLRF